MNPPRLAPLPFPAAAARREANRAARRSVRSLRLAAAAVLLGAAAGVAASCSSRSTGSAHPRLSALRVSAAGSESETTLPMTPEFSPEIHHYAVRCGDPETLSVSAAAPSGVSAVILEGVSVPLPLEDREVPSAPGRAVTLEVRAGRLSTNYAVHCVSLDFPSEVRTVSRAPRRSDGLLLVDPSYLSETGERISHIAILDDNGVPRFHRRVRERAYNFRWHGKHRLYSYARTLPKPEGAGEDEPAEVEIVLLDEALSPIRRVEPVGIAGLDFHDFTLTEEANYLFVVYRPAERDLSPYPDENGEYSYSAAEPTRDSVIQEVTPDGEVVFEWNSWENADGSGPNLSIPDCLAADFFPDDYAHLNSLFLSDGDIVASFRGCGQVLKIERPSGRVLWQLGGAAPAIADGRIHYRIVGDPEPAGFCGQHTAIERPPGTITLLDNGVRCPSDPRGRREPGAIFQNHHTRVVEYRLTEGSAVFSREYRRLFPSPIAGAVQVLPDGNWSITTGFRGRLRDEVVLEVDATGREVWAMELNADRRPEIYRAHREFGLRVPLNSR